MLMTLICPVPFVACTSINLCPLCSHHLLVCEMRSNHPKRIFDRWLNDLLFVLVGKRQLDDDSLIDSYVAGWKIVLVGFFPKNYVLLLLCIVMKVDHPTLGPPFQGTQQHFRSLIFGLKLVFLFSFCFRSKMEYQKLLYYRAKLLH